VIFIAVAQLDYKPTNI